MPKFIICRASEWEQKNSPCDGAVLVKENESWNEWEIEINSLDELLALMDRVGDNLIIGRNNITIYDDYVE